MRGHAHRLDGKAVGRGLFLVLGNGGNGVRLAGGIQNTDGLGLRLQRADELQLALHGQFIAGAGHIAGIQLGLYRVGNGGKNDRDVFILSGGVAGRGAGGGNTAHQGHIVGAKALGDLLGDVIIKPGVLVVDGIVGAFHQAGVLQPLQKALPAVIQTFVLAVLADADDRGFFLAAGGKAEYEHYGKNKGKNFFQVGFHGVISFSWSVVILLISFFQGRAPSPSRQYSLFHRARSFPGKIKNPIPRKTLGTGLKISSAVPPVIDALQHPLCSYTHDVSRDG